MSDPQFDPTDEEKVEIHAIQEGEKASENIRRMTEEIEDKHREGAEKKMKDDLTDERIL